MCVRVCVCLDDARPRPRDFLLQVGSDSSESDAESDADELVSLASLLPFIIAMYVSSDRSCTLVVKTIILQSISLGSIPTVEIFFSRLFSPFLSFHAFSSTPNQQFQQSLFKPFSTLRSLPRYLYFSLSLSLCLSFSFCSFCLSF